MDLSSARPRSRVPLHQAGAVRYNAGEDRFEVCYLAESERVARLEGRELYGDPALPGGAFQHPTRRLLIVTVELALRRIVDLTIEEAQTVLGMSAQELTGDWLGYRHRTHPATVPRPVGVAPTQALGAALFATGDVEGFLCVSRQKPDACNLVLFPERLEQLGLGSWVRMRNTETDQTH